MRIIKDLLALLSVVMLAYVVFLYGNASHAEMVVNYVVEAAKETWTYQHWMPLTVAGISMAIFGLISWAGKVRQFFPRDRHYLAIYSLFHMISCTAISFAVGVEIQLEFMEIIKTAGIAIFLIAFFNVIIIWRMSVYEGKRLEEHLKFLEKTKRDHLNVMNDLRSSS